MTRIASLITLQQRRCLSAGDETKSHKDAQSATDCVSHKIPTYITAAGYPGICAAGISQNRSACMSQAGGVTSIDNVQDT